MGFQPMARKDMVKVTMPLWDQMRNLRILCYHDIASSSGVKLPGRAFPTLEEFRRQMTFLKESCRVVTLDEIARYCKAGKGPREFSVAITFDDGAAGVMTAAPVMFELEIPFTVFLATRFIGSDELPWFVYLNAIADRAKEYAASLEADGHRFQMADPAEFREFRGLAKRELLEKGYYDQMKMLYYWATKVDMALADVRSGPRKFLTWEQVRQLAGKGVAFGSHTHSHLDLTRLQGAHLELEISLSKGEILEHIGREHTRFVAYPDGRFDGRILEMARQYHEMGFAASYGNASWNDLYRLPRRGISGGNLAMLKHQLSTGKELASWVKHGIRGIRGGGV
jgi:peptidoglycan/xylan/chitin deacetylase (PgdA/CDA1 family)